MKCFVKIVVMGLERKIDMKLEKRLLNACLYGDVEKVAQCLEAVTDVNIQNEYGNTPLHFACVAKNTEIVKMLLRANADVNISNNKGVTPLHIACGDGSYDIVKLLCERNINMNDKTYCGATSLHMAASGGHSEVVKLLLEKEGIDLDIQDDRQNTALQYACYLGNVEIVKCLIDKGANVNIQNANKVTPLHTASNMGSTEIARLILERDVDLTIKDETLSTPLHCAADRGNEDIVWLILLKNRRSSVNPRDYLNMEDILGRTAIENAVKGFEISYGAQKDNIVNMLILEGSKISRDVVDWKVKREDIDMLKLLARDNDIRQYLIKELIVSDKKDILKEVVRDLRKDDIRIATNENVDNTSVLGAAIESNDVEIADMFMKNNSNTVKEKITKLKELIEDDNANALLKRPINEERKIMKHIKREREQDNILDLLYAGGNHIKRASMDKGIGML